MSVTFEKSETRENLMRAFAGESQARNRYTFAAGLARKKDLQVIQGVFAFTAAQEEQHAKLFYEKLEKLSGETVGIDGTYPVDLYPDLLRSLRAAAHNEYQEWEHDYAHFADTARQEGFQEIAHLFDGIAAIERTHGERFQAFADLLEAGKLFVSDVSCTWMCLNCGAVVKTTVAPGMCPVCRHPQGFFVRWEMAPFEGRNGTDR